MKDKLLLSSLLLIAGTYAPLLLYVALPKALHAQDAYHWLGLGCAIVGIVFSFLLRNRVNDPFQELKRQATLQGFPSQDKRAVLVRIAYTASYIGLRLNGAWVAVSVLAMLMKK